MRPQMRVQAVAKASGHKMFRNIALRDVPERVHAGVGAAGAVNANRLAADRLDRGLQRALHRGTVVLDLPAAERRAVIFDGEFIAGHIDPVRSSEEERHHPRKRMIQYSEASPFNLETRGVLDTPPSRGMTISREVRASLQRRTAQEFLRLHRRLAGTPQLENP